MTDTTAKLDSILHKIRALLANAEDPATPEEARDAYVSKAQELLTRHAIDEALLDGANADEVTSRTIEFAGKYGDAQATLVFKIARANRCRAVHTTRYDPKNWKRKIHSSVVVGYPSEIETVELLFTSLWIQATAGVLNARPPFAWSGAEVAAYRKNWLYGFSTEVGQRLTTARKATETEADSDGSLLPVLVSRQAIVDSHLSELFPRLTTSRRSLGAGYGSGRQAGAKADVGSRRIPSRRALGR